MTDIARLGLAIESQSVTTATTALDKFQASAAMAAKASDTMAKAAQPAAANTTAIQKSADAAAKSLDTVAKQTGLTRSEMINLSRQLQDVGVSLVSGQSPFMVLAQQGAQIADVFGSSKTGTVGGALRQIGSGIASVLTPVRLLAAGFAAVAVGTVLTIKNLADTGKQFDDVSRSVGALNGALRDFATAAGFKGISQGDFLKSIQEWAPALYDAQHNMGGLGEFLRANGKSAKDFQGTLETVADLIKNAGNDQERLQLLQRAGLPATMDWVRFLSQGKDGIRAAINEAANFNASAEANLVAKARAFDDAWNKAITNTGRGLRGMALDGAGLLESLGDKAIGLLMKLPGIGKNVPGNILRNALGDRAAGYDVGSRLTGNSDVSGFYSGLGAGAPGNSKSTTRDPNVIQREIGLEQQRLALLGQTATAAEQALGIQKQADAAKLQGVAVDQKRIDILKQITRETAIGVTAIKAQADAETVAAGAVGMSVGQATAYATAQNALNDAKRRGQTLAPEEIASIQQNADALGRAAERTDQLRFGYENLVRGPLQTFVSNLRQGKSAWESFRAAGNSALDAIAGKLADMAARELWSAAFGGTSGGIFSSLFSSGSAATAAAVVAHSGMGPGEVPAMRHVPAGVFANAPRFHSGVGPGEMAAVIRRDESVLTPAQMKQLGPRGGAGPITIGDTVLQIMGNADNKAIDAISRELAKHRDAIAGIVAGRQSEARYASFGVR